jgi:hypothetical protein
MQKKRALFPAHVFQCPFAGIGVGEHYQPSTPVDDSRHIQRTMFDDCCGITKLVRAQP